MNIYHYHPITGEFLGIGLADKSPLEPDVFHVPAFATTTETPALEDGFARIFADGSWSQVMDRRGETWWSENGAAVVVGFIGDPGDQGLSDIEPEPIDHVPIEISDRQFFQQMAHDGQITEQEALDAVGSGIIPAAMEVLIEMLPANQQFAARMLVRGATTFRRDHPVTALIGQLFGMADNEIDDLWRAASAL